MAGEAKYEKKKIIVGDFIFGLEGDSFTNRWRWFWNKTEISEEYENLAMKMMNLHNEFYGQFKNRKIEEYVTANTYVYCDKGENNSATPWAKHMQNIPRGYLCVCPLLHFPWSSVCLTFLCSPLCQSIL